MSTPYYDADGITLWHGDCREQTAWLDADVLVTDPPYGIGWQGTTYQGRAGAKGVQTGNRASGIAGDLDTEARDAVLAAWFPKPAAVFGSFYAPTPNDVRHFAVFQKQPSAGIMGGRIGFRRDIEAIYLLGSWPVAPAIHSSVFRTTTIGNGGELSRRVGHPHAKPLDVMNALVQACPPGVIADPFAGSGSTLLAARAQGRRAIGVEVEERYCELIAGRLAQGDLFGGAA